MRYLRRALLHFVRGRRRSCYMSNLPQGEDEEDLTRVAGAIVHARIDARQSNAHVRTVKPDSGKLG